MADLNFPTNPQVGDTYTIGSRTWAWNGIAWVLQSSVQSLDPFTVVKLVVTTTTNSINTVSGAAIIAGGLSVGKDVFVGGIVNATELQDQGRRVINTFSPSAGSGISITGFTTVEGTATFTINNTGVTSIYGTDYLGASGFVGDITLTNLGVQTITAGTDTAVSANTGSVVIWNTSTLQSVTNKGNVTTNSIQILNTQTSGNTTTNGAFLVSGGAGIKENLNVGGNLTVWGTTVFNGITNFNGTTTEILSTNTFYTDNLIELHVYDENNLSTEWPFDDTRDIGFRFHYFNRSLNTGTSAALVLANDTQWLEWHSTGFETSGTITGGNYGGIKAAKLQLVDTSQSTSTTTGALVVAGGVGVGGKLNASELYDAGQRVVTSVVPAAGVGVSLTNINNSGTTATFTINNTGVTATIGTTYIGVSSSTGAVTFTNLGVTQAIAGVGITVSSNTGNVTISNSGVTSITAGSGTYITTSTGNVTIWSAGDLQTVTNNGNSTTNIVIISNTTPTSGTGTGALQVAGGVSIGGNLWVSGSFYANGQAILTTASFASGLNSGTDIQVVLETATNVVTFNNTSTLQSVTGRGATTTNAISITNATNSTSTNSGALKISGGVGVGENLYVGGNIKGTVVTATNYLTVGDTHYSYFTSPTIMTSNPVNLDSFGVTEYRTAKYLVQVADSGYTPHLTHSAELLLTHDGNGVSAIGYVVQYGIVTNFGELGTWDAVQAGGVLTLVFTPSYVPTNLVVKVSRQAITALTL